MAKYSDIKGFTVQTLSTDTIANQAAGGSWASGGDMNTARRALASAGIQTAAITFGGYTTTQVALNEQYNGSSWTEVADLNAARHGIRGVGIYTAALAVGGLAPSATAANESWDGSSWTEIGDLNTARGNFAGASGNGTTTAALVFGGYTSGPGATGTVAINESWDGSSWTEVGDLNNVGSQGPSGVGTSTAAIRASSNTQPSGYAPVENWDGSSWTEGTNMNTNRGEDPGANGTQTDALVYGGFTTPPATTRANTEAWDGTSWTEVTDLSTARYALTGCGTTGASSALAMGGYSTANHASTEEWTAPATFNQIQEGQLFFNSTANAFKETITDLGAGAWASGANVNTSRENGSGAGDSAEAALLIGGYTTAAPTVRVANTESWDGSSWTEVNDLNQARYVLQSVGTSTAALAFGGDTPPNTGKTESWNGSSWTETTDLNTARANLGGTGPYTSALAVGGYSTAYTGDTETWDGSSWTEVNNLNEARGLQSSVGVTQTASLAVSGDFPQATNVEQWDGSSWTEIAEVNTARYNSSGSCSTTLGLIFGGRIFPGSPPAAYSALTESWNGTAWTERADLATARGDGGSAQNISNNSKALYFTGSNPPYVYTEEWTAPLANKTITAS